MSSHSWPGRLTSSMYSPAPRMKRGSSLRLTEWPMPPISGLVRSSRSISVVIVVAPAQPAAAGSAETSWPSTVSAATTGADSRSRSVAGGLLDRLDDVHVAGAAAEVAADPLADLRLGRVGVLAEQPGGLHDHPRGAEAALEAVLVPERLLERMEGGAVGHALDGPDLAAVGLDGEHRARLGALAVDVDGARAAVARVAADVGAGQPEVVAQEVDEQEARLDVGLVGLAVDGDA